MSQLRPEDGRPTVSRAACRKGRHHYGESQKIGAGILRRVCEACGEVTIDLTGVDELKTPVLRTSSRIWSLSTRDS